MKVLKLLVAIIFASLLFYACKNRSEKDDKHNNAIDNASTDTIGVLKEIFDIAELSIAASPIEDKHFRCSSAEQIIDYDISPKGGSVAVITKDAAQKARIKFWQINENKIADSCLLPNGLVPQSITWHPRANALFVMGLQDGKYHIFRFEKNGSNWNNKTIFSSPNQLKRLVACPRPFITSYDNKNENKYYAYRLFFGMKNGNETFRIVSITENGNRFYQVVGPASTITKPNEDEMEPSKMESDFALPIAFHPAGNALIWENRRGKYFVANYESKYWGNSNPMNIAINTGGTINPTPNGLGFLHWQKNKKGVGVYLLSTKAESVQIGDYDFISSPVCVPDGKGVIGLTMVNNQCTLNYVPIVMPLADVINAWMFGKSSEEVDLFKKYNGLFRPNKGEQLYSLYETENYNCDGYDRNSPTRPYLVTTDIFWELFGAAYQGLFIINERDGAIPNFWSFVNEADGYFKKANNKSAWIPVFAALKDFNAGNSANPEAKRIEKETDNLSTVTNEEYEFSDLKPRGHYTSSPEMSKYFKAFRYFTTIHKKNKDAVNELAQLPKSISAYAEKWIESYAGFIAPSRSPLVWNNVKRSTPAYCQHPNGQLSIFPLSWGFDNEIFKSTIYDETVPQEFQIKGPSGERLLPSGIDLATVMGNSFAEKLLESDYTKYPPLRKVINNLKKNFKENFYKSDLNNNLYNHWLNAIAVQWADTLNPAFSTNDKDLWQAKRLQTGLATWATLRHATILVNERTSAECGEGGFEEIVMRAPRGYVEPDPQTFAAIANLFESAIKYVSKTTVQKPDVKDMEESGKRTLYDGIVARLIEAAQEAHAFQQMAEKERKGEPLSNEENEKILYTARIAEHLFLVFNSLSNKDYALSNPDPIGKIADVAGNSQTSYLMAAVGNAMEWNYVVPFYGRH